MNQLDVPTSCAECQGGRLIGQAVLEPDGGWRYFLACTDCDTKLELGQGSTPEPARASTEVVVATANGGGHDPETSAGSSGVDLARETIKGGDRTCGHPGCGTLLSSYNATAACWAHTGPSFP